MQHNADNYLLQNFSTCFGCPLHPSSGEHKTLIAASGTGHCISATTFFHRCLIMTRWRYYATLEEGCYSDTMNCTRRCSFNFMYSWWWVQWTPEICRV